VEAGLNRLEALQAADPRIEEVVGPLRRAAEIRHQRYTERVALLSSVEDQTLPPMDDRYQLALRARREMISAEREELLAWRDAGQLPDADLRVLERELDHEESLLPG